MTYVQKYDFLWDFLEDVEFEHMSNFVEQNLIYTCVVYSF